MKIGIFDSGIGGMTIAQSIIKKNPQTSIVFFGDTAWFPYNDKSAEEVLNRSIYACELLISKGCSIIIIACNTALSVSQEILEKNFSHRVQIQSIIDLTIKETLKRKNEIKIAGIIGTIHTINSGIYEKKIRILAPQILLQKLTTPKLGALAEDFFINPETNIDLLYEYLNSNELKNIDTLLLACTHYSVFRKEIENFYNKKVTAIDAINTTNEAIEAFIKKKKIKNKKEKTLVLCSKKTDNFTSASKEFLGSDLIIQEV